MSEQTTFTEADRADGVEPDMVDQNNAPKSEAPTAPTNPGAPVTTTDTAKAEATVKSMCEKLLANTVIENYTISIA